MSKCVATSTSFSDADLLALFDDAGSDEAGTELLDHFKTRQSPRWYFDMRNGSLAETPFAWPHRPDLNPETVVDLAADLLKGRVRLHGGIELDLPSDFAWRNSDTTNFGVPGNGFRCADVFFTLAYAHAVTNEKRFLDGFERLVDHWLTDWPFEIDEAFSADGLVFSKRSSFKSMPTGHRIVNWISCFYTAAPYQIDQRLGFGLLKELIFTGLGYRRFTEARYADGNHHIMRCGTIPGILSLMFPEIELLTSLRGFSKATLETHLARSVLPDGGYEERSISYSRASLQMISAPVRIASINGDEFVSPPLGQRLARSLVTLVHLTLPDGTPAPFGDGVASLERARVYKREVSEIEAIQKRALRPPSGRIPDLLYLPNSGYFVVRRGDLTEETVVVISIPDGSNSVLGHSHDDALSIVYATRGCTIISDPAAELYLFVNTPSIRGTALRGYTYSMEAHNVVLPRGRARIDAAACIKRWNAPHTEVESHVTTSHLNSGSLVRLSASHRAYGDVRLDRNLEISADGELRVVDQVIPDRLEPGDDHLIRWNFDWGVEVSIEQNAEDRLQLRAAKNGRTISLTVNPDASTDTRMGDVALYRNSDRLAVNPLRPDTDPPFVLDVRFQGERGDGSVTSVFTHGV